MISNKTFVIAFTPDVKFWFIFKLQMIQTLIRHSILIGISSDNMDYVLKEMTEQKKKEMCEKSNTQIS